MKNVTDPSISFNFSRHSKGSLDFDTDDYSTNGKRSDKTDIFENMPKMNVSEKQDYLMRDFNVDLHSITSKTSKDNEWILKSRDRVLSPLFRSKKIRKRSRSNSSVESFSKKKKNSLKKGKNRDLNASTKINSDK